VAELWVTQLGRLPYAEALALQHELRDRRQRDEIPDTLLLLEHDPVYTKGRRATAADLPMGEDWYRMQGVEIEEIDRGGAVTYHGPGQLVGYPIMRIGGVHEYVETMERAMIQMLADEKVEARSGGDLTGVWVGDRKIGSIGIHVQSRVTTHGFAINVDNDLQPFEWIVPCGIDHVRMTSLYLETGMPSGMPCFRKRAAWRFAQAFGLKQRIVSLDRLRVSSLVA
jgi:lipoyl(octanoyl) transferase